MNKELFYWGRYEPEEGKPDRDTLMKTAQYLSGKGVRVKGHPLVQAITTWDATVPP